MYHSRVSNTSWCLANSASTSASEMQWNAKSHAAYHGYSHLSGMEIMSALLRCCHSWLRPCLRSLGVGICVVYLQLRVKFIGLAQTCGKGGVEIGERLRARGFAQAQSNTRRTA